MVYQKQNWITGQTITKEKLNHIEEGIYNTDNWLIVQRIFNSENNNVELDKTVQEINDALPYVIVLHYLLDSPEHQVIKTMPIFSYQVSPSYRYNFGEGNIFQANDLLDYPCLEAVA